MGVSAPSERIAIVRCATTENLMLASLITAIALAIGIAAPHAHAAAPAVSGHVHVTAFDGNGSGPPTHP
jgi:hypothetical protein